MRDREAGILVVGGGLGGVAGALAALRLGQKVLLTEETSWIGGQLTAQGVPPDEHPWIEGMGCTATYQRLRTDIRDYYRRNYPLLPRARFDPYLNPGQGRVSPLCSEPRVALAVLNQLLAPYLAGLQLEIIPRCRAIGAETTADKIISIKFEDSHGHVFIVHPEYVLDATELGDVIALAGAEHIPGER